MSNLHSPSLSTPFRWNSSHFYKTLRTSNFSFPPLRASICSDESVEGWIQFLCHFVARRGFTILRCNKSVSVSNDTCACSAILNVFASKRRCSKSASCRGSSISPSLGWKTRTIKQQTWWKLLTGAYKWRGLKRASSVSRQRGSATRGLSNKRLI